MRYCVTCRTVFYDHPKAGPLPKQCAHCGGTTTEIPPLMEVKWGVQTIPIFCEHQKSMDQPCPMCNRTSEQIQVWKEGPK